MLAGVNWWGGHQVNVVELDGRPRMVDPGNGAPFFDPIPLDQVFEIHHLGLSYRFRPGDDEHAWVQDRWIEGEWRIRTPETPPETPPET